MGSGLSLLSVSHSLWLLHSLCLFFYEDLERGVEGDNPGRAECSKVSLSLRIWPLHHSISGVGRYFASDQEGNINTMPVTDSLVYNGLVPAGYDRTMVAQAYRSSQGISDVP